MVIELVFLWWLEALFICKSHTNQQMSRGHQTSFLMWHPTIRTCHWLQGIFLGMAWMWLVSVCMQSWIMLRLSWIAMRAYPQVCHGVNLIQNLSGRIRYGRGFILLLDETLVTELVGCIEGVVAPRYQVIIKLVVRSRLGPWSCGYQPYGVWL